MVKGSKFVLSNRDKQAFYNSTRWRKLTYKIRSKHHHRCVECWEIDGILTPPDVVHHELPIDESLMNWEMRWDEDKLIPLCHKHHNIKHNRHGGDSVKNKRERISNQLSYNGGVIIE